MSILNWLLTIVLLPFRIPVYYWSSWRPLLESLVDEIPFLNRSAMESRELWLPADRYRRHNHWEVRLPQRCAVCGRWVPRGEIHETRRVDDHSFPVLSVVLGLLVGFLVYYFGLSLWYLPIVLGVIFGYLLRPQADVDIYFRRCAEHSNKRLYPRIRALGEHLVVRLGNRSARREFSDYSRDDVVKPP